MKIVLVGGVAGGASAAVRLRRLNEHDEIILLEKGPYISYANCGLPYYIGGVINDKSKLLLQTPESLNARFNIDVRVNNEAVKIDRTKKEITVKDTQTGKTYIESYDKLVLSCGSKAIRPPVPGLDKAKNVFTLRTVDDTFAIKEFISTNLVKRAVVVGGGFIGVEVAENLRFAGIDVTLVEKLPQVLGNFDFEMAQIIHQEMCTQGISLSLGDGIEKFTDEGRKVVLESGIEIETDITVLAIGIRAENVLAKEANLALSERGFVKNDSKFHPIDAATGKADSDIYTIGDMAEVIHGVTGEAVSVPLAWGANRQGRLVADDINGIGFDELNILGVSALKVFGLCAASTGLSETMAKKKGYDYEAVHAIRGNHAGYYPNASNIVMKVIFEKKTGRILGAQAVGGEGTEKRIDVISTAMKLGASVFKLSQIELCYAPPFSSAKDPVNIIGYIAENVNRGEYINYQVSEIDRIVSDGAFVLDVRTPFEYNLGHVEGAVNIGVDDIRANLERMPKDKNAPIYVYCQVGLRGYIASKILKGHGYTKIYNMSGGYSLYKNYKYNAVVCAKSKNENNEDVDMQTNVSLKKEVIELDCAGLQCPGPIMATYKKLSEMKEGEQLKITATDSGFLTDVQNWARTNGHKTVKTESENGRYIAVIEKGTGEITVSNVGCNQENATIVLFSGELDKAIAAMIIAQGAVAQGKKVSVFCTFWGLNALRKPKKPKKLNKTFIEKMFGMMMPCGAEKLPLSSMNMAGIGQKMIKGIMKKHQVDAISVMIQKAQEVGVQLLACTMSMELMGLKKEELIDGLEYVGVGTYISRNENVGTTLFI